ncbi:hypothetical protein [Lysobacter enzymogenes]|uniref:Lipoprotein n=1 Tax=Lysobacter enzymogenes TaxID=69 RepID=A0AAU9AUA5_LYSEN|nr:MULTISPECIES: hypothetical protein [Bacteria]MDT0872047.1 hypothetical protein [Staphylococcus pseudintermedius]BAV99933.1 hypothetical protein LEN_4446 [Lysobacter enzymogenes]
MKIQHRSNRLSLIAVAAFGFAASLSAFATEPSCESCRLAYVDCLNFAAPLGYERCNYEYVQCSVYLDCPISNL